MTHKLLSAALGLAVAGVLATGASAATLDDVKGKTAAENATSNWSEIARKAGADVEVRNRSAERGAELVADLGGRLAAPGQPLDLSSCEILVNATAVGLAKPGAEPGAAGSDLKKLGIEADGLDEHLILVDLVYGAEPTELTAAGRRGGAKVVDGREILVRQGALSFRIWTGLEPPLQAMRDAIEEQRR